MEDQTTNGGGDIEVRDGDTVLNNCNAAQPASTRYRLE